MKTGNAPAASANQRHQATGPAAAAQRRSGLFARLSGWVRTACRRQRAAPRRDKRSRARLLQARLRRPKRVDGPWQPDGGVRALARAFSDPDARVRLRALEVVSGFSGEFSTRLVSGAIHDVDPEVRCAAVRVASRLGVAAVIPALIVATEDPDPDVRDLSMGAIAVVADRLFDAPAPPAGDAAALKSWWRKMRLRELLDASN